MTSANSKTHARGGRDFDKAAYERRLKAAGLGDEMPEDLDEFRLDLARRIVMFVNAWHGCPELLCQRNRGCMAPDIRCSNVAPLPPEEADRQWREVRDEIVFAVKAHLDHHAGEVAALEAEDEAKAKAAAARGVKDRDKCGSGV